MTVCITMEFPTEEHAKRYFSWMSDGGGEQDYWDSCEARDEEAVTFDYFGGLKDGEFLGNWVVVCTVGKETDTAEDDPDFEGSGVD